MSGFFAQVFTLLTTPAGSLTYQLVLAFSIAAALAAAFNAWRSTGFVPGRRMVFGLGLLLALRLLLFVLSGLGWQGLIDAELFMPPLDRAVSLISVVIIIWMWVFPHPRRAIDAAALLTGFLVLTLLALGLVWWGEQGVGQSFNGSWPDVLACLFALVFIAAGLFMLFSRRPPAWGLGLGMLGLLFLGPLVHLILLPTPGDYAAFVRLTELAAYPLLLGLPQRFPLLPMDEPAYTGRAVEQASGLSDGFSILEPRLLPVLLKLASNPDAENCQAFVRLICAGLNADLCILLDPPNTDGRLVVHCVYNAREQSYLSVRSLESRQVPVIASMLRRSRTLRLPVGSTSPDMYGLARALDLQTSGHLLAVPIAEPDHKPEFGLVLLSPYSGRGWTDDDEHILLAMGRLLAHLRRQQHRLDLLQAEAAGSVSAPVAVEAVPAPSEGPDVLPQVTAALVARLQSENDELRRMLNNGRQQDPETVGFLEGELRLALEEVAHLKAALSEADMKLLALSKETAAPPLSDDQRELVAGLSRDLRQPLSSVLGYTDFLLGESLGILGGNQRKFLERIRVATERMSHLVNELVRIASSEEGELEADRREPVELNAVIDDAIAETRDALRKKNIALRVNLPEELPALQASRRAMFRVLTELLHNARAVTPEGGDIFLRLRLEAGDGGQSYVLVQVSDSGPGLERKDLPRVFSRRWGRDGSQEPPVPGLAAEDVNLALVRSLVERMGGRIWVDSQPGRGATFSILFPVIPASGDEAGE